MKYDFTIIGAGIIGVMIARELSKYNSKILILEKENDVSMGSTKANSGIVHGGYDDKHGTVKSKVSYKGRLKYEQLEKELNFGFKKTGSLVVGYNEEDRLKLQEILENGLKNGVSDIRIIETDEILKMEPNVSPNVKYALYCEGAGVCSPYEFAIALAENAVKNGVVLNLNSEVLSIKKRENYGYEISYLNDNDMKTIESKYVINCAGVYSDKISQLVGENYFEIKPRKGEYIIFARDTGNIMNTVVFQVPTKLGKGVLVTSTYHGNLMIGPDAQNDVEKDDTSTKKENLDELIEKALKVTDKFNLNQFIRTFSGIRSASSTGDFIIEETKSKGFINVAGIQSPGLTSAPEIADMVVDIIKQSGYEFFKNEKFDPYRAAIIKKKNKEDMIDAKEINERIALPLGDEDRIVCRCEQVTEKTIRDSFRRGIKVTTVDGVKRRTRAGMGWCQGTFCRSRVKEIIENEYDIKIDDKEDVEHSGINRVGKKELLENS